MSMVAFRVPDTLKKEMDQVHINWSEYLRHSIEEALESQKKREIFDRMQALMGGQKGAPDGTAASIVRHMRDHG